MTTKKAKKEKKKPVVLTYEEQVEIINKFKGAGYGEFTMYIQRNFDRRFNKKAMDFKKRKEQYS